MHIYIDIETIPTQRPEERARVEEAVRPPGSMSKPETIERWWETKGAEAKERAYRDTALSGNWGEIVVIGLATKDSPPKCISERSEAGTIKAAFAWLMDMSYGHTITYVGHNIGFDLRVLYQRAVVNRVMPPVLHHNATPWSGHYIDTMYEWAGQGGHVSLSELCRVLDIESDDEMTGADVWDAWREGRRSNVAEHCRSDVERVREVHRRLAFLTDGGAAVTSTMTGEDT